jgi:integrase
VSRGDLQEIVDGIRLDRDASTVRNALMPVRAIYRRAVQRDIVQVSPTEGLVLPAVEGRRDRVATPEGAAELLAAPPEDDRAVWAGALYAGLRLGELQALGWENIDFGAGLVRVEWSWDKKAGRVRTKSRAGRRVVPIPDALRSHLERHWERCLWQTGLAFGRSKSVPFSDSTLRTRAKREWNAAGLLTIGFHEARHTYASLMIAAEINAKVRSTFMGHQSITTTLDRYGHLFPGSEAEAAARLDAYLAAEEIFCLPQFLPHRPRRSRNPQQTRAISRACAGLENRFGEIPPTRVRIPPPPFCDVSGHPGHMCRDIVDIVDV